MPSDTVSGKTSSDIENVDWSVGTGQLPNVVRFGSSSSQASQSSGDICRICHCESDSHNPLLTPCYCSGSLKYVHQACLQQWLTASETNACELCKFPFIMHTKIKPFNEWRSLDMSGVERRRLFCGVLFHCAAALCVIWSLCVLIERASEEVKRGLIGWPFWTKLVVVTVGFAGGLVFMYIQCRQYLHLCNRWRARNRILLIQNAPEKINQIATSSPVLQQRQLPRNSSSSMTGPNNYNSGGNESENHNCIRPPSHGQIIANIENNHLNYDRDWTLDDISQTSFKPCPQGSGSMTPLAFHDSVHNIYETQLKSCSASNPVSHHSSNEHNLNSSHSYQQQQHQHQHQQQQLPNNNPNKNINNNCNNTGSNRTNDLSLFKVPNSAVFLENRDILNDTGYPKIYHRHSTVLMTPEINDNLDKYLGKDTRRYSDTKLLLQQKHQFDGTMSTASGTVPAAKGENIEMEKNDNDGVDYDPIFNVTNLLLGPCVQAAAHNYTPQITDIIFESNGHSSFDPLELNIQELLELDIRTQQQHQRSQQKSNLSLNDEPSKLDRNEKSDGRNKFHFKSLPNLSASSENLLPK